MDVALLSVLRDGLLRRSEAAELRWGDLELQEDGSARLHVRRSKTDPEAEGVVLYIGQEATQALQAIMPEDTAVVDPARRVFELSASRSAGGSMLQPRLRAWARVSLATRGGWAWAQDLAASGVELPELMTAGRWKSSRMPARYTERQAAGRGAVARYYQGRGG